MAQKQRRVDKPNQNIQTRQVSKNLTIRPKEEDKRPLSPNTHLSPNDTTHLQRPISNQAIGRAIRIQPKLTLGLVGDKYEQEAESVSKQVDNCISNPPQAGMQRQEEDVQKSPEQRVQRQGEEEEDLQMKPLPTISTLQRQEEEEEVQSKADEQRQKEEEIQTKSKIQRQDKMMPHFIQ